jgi:hypothetical protein
LPIVSGIFFASSGHLEVVAGETRLIRLAGDVVVDLGAVGIQARPAN